MVGLYFPVVSSSFKYHENKRPGAVLKTILNLPRIECLASCLITSGCYAVNIGISTCELIEGLSIQDTFGDTVSLYIMSRCICRSISLVKYILSF